MKCKAKNRKGKQCGAMALKSEDFCLFHSDSEQAKKYQQLGRAQANIAVTKPWPNKRLIVILQRDLKELEKIDDIAL